MENLKEEPKPLKDMLPLTEVDWEKFKKNPIPSKKEEPKQTNEKENHLTYRGVFKEPNIISDWLEKNGDPEIDKQVEQEAKELCVQNKISEEELERVISAPINLYSAIKFLFNKFKKK